MREPTTTTTPAEAVWAVWSTVPDPATIVRQLIRMPTDGDIARQLAAQITRLASGALECEKVEDFLDQRDGAAPQVIWKLVALDQLDVGVAEAPGPAVERMVARAGAWGGDAWADAVLDSWTAIGQARVVRDRLAHRRDVSADALAPVILEHTTALLNWSCAMLCTTVLTHELASAGSDDVLVAVRRLLTDSARQAFRSLRAFELSLPTTEEPPSLFRELASDEERELEEDAHLEGERVLRFTEQG